MIGSKTELLLTETYQSKPGHVTFKMRGRSLNYVNESCQHGQTVGISVGVGEVVIL